MSLRKNRFVQAAAASLLGFFFAASIKPALKQLVFPTPPEQAAAVRHPAKITDTRTIAGKIKSCVLDGDELNVVLTCKDDNYQVTITKKTDVTSHFPRVEHTPASAAEWIQKNPDCDMMVGVYKGQVTNVMLMPHEQQSSPSPQ